MMATLLHMLLYTFMLHAALLVGLGDRMTLERYHSRGQFHTALQVSVTYYLTSQEYC